MTKIRRLSLLALAFSLIMAIVLPVAAIANEQEIANLLALDDDRLLDAISRRTFDFFWQEANPVNGLIKDRSTAASPCSIAAVGFGLAAIPTGIERGWITREEGYARTLTTLRTFLQSGVEGKNGFFFHFIDMKTGRRVWNCELSSIDSTLFIAGALTAAQYFRDTEAAKIADQLYEQMDWQWMMNKGGNRDNPSMGWTPENGFLGARWGTFCEGPILTILAIGSPTHPISAAAWDGIWRPLNRTGAYVCLPAETLFVYQYPHCFIDFRDKEDKYANYWNNTAAAIKHNRSYTLANRGKYKSYWDAWGLSAGDGPDGYRAYGASDGNHDGTVQPYASVASLPFQPELAMDAIRRLLRTQGTKIWGKYGFVSGFNVDRNWYSTEYIGIDQGDILLMLENYRSGLIWKYFMRNAGVQEAMAKIGFVDKKSDYAATPDFLAGKVR